MTIGQLVECLTGKVSSLAGSEGDGTAFNTAITVDSVARVLHSMGYQVSTHALHARTHARPFVFLFFSVVHACMRT